MRIVPLTLTAAALAALSTLALARSTKPAEVCTAPVEEIEPAEACTASAKLCENWAAGRAIYRATFPGKPRCG